MATGPLSRPSAPPSRRARRAAALGVACLLGALAPACANPLPGTQLGTYRVIATGSANTCGLDAPASDEFYVELSRQGSTLYWNWLNNSPIASGTLAPVSATDAALQASLTATQDANVDPTASGNGPCTMDRTDELTLTLATDSPPKSFAGTMSYTFSAVSGADCSDQLSASGGMYAALPCVVSYTIAATRQ
jgi:hypothetical protein